MWEYIAIIITFGGAILGILGGATDKNGKVKLRGWVALALATIGSVGAISLKWSSENIEKQQQGIALIQLQENLSRHLQELYAVSDELEDFEPSNYFGESVFDVSLSLFSLDRETPDFNIMKESYRNFYESNISTVQLFQDVLPIDVINSVVRLRNGTLAKYYLNWSLEKEGSFSFEELENDFKVNTGSTLGAHAEILFSSYNRLGFSIDFEEQYRETGHVKDDQS